MQSARNAAVPSVEQWWERVQRVLELRRWVVNRILTVERALLEAAAEVEDVLADPAPTVAFMEFGDSSLNFQLRAWTTTFLHQKSAFVSKVNFAIHRKLDEHGITVPFPQRDLHLKDGELRVVMQESGRTL